MKLIVSRQNRPEQVVDTWRDMSQVFEIMNRVKNQMFGENISFFFWFERGREREKSKSSFGDPQSSVGWNPSSQELKFISSTRATHTYQERGILLKIQRRRFGEIKGFGLMRCS